MNISLPQTTKGKAQPRGSRRKEEKTTRKSILDEDDDGDDDEREREALHRKNTEAATSGILDDYDGDYENFSSQAKILERKRSEAFDRTNKNNNPKKSRFVSNLLVRAEERERERAFAYERKLAREAEADGSSIANGEKFVTGSYRRRLEERKLWEARTRDQSAREEADDAAKRAGGAVATSLPTGIYGGLLMGGRRGRDGIFDDDRRTEEKGTTTSGPVSTVSNATELKATEGDEISSSNKKYDKDDTSRRTMEKPTTIGEPKRSGVDNQGGKDGGGNEGIIGKQSNLITTQQQEKLKRMTINVACRKLRAEKLAAARERYFARCKQRETKQ